MNTQSTSQLPVSSGNPCPFLRALVADGKLQDDVEPLTNMVSVIGAVVKHGESTPALTAPGIYAIAMVANGVGPVAVLKTNLHGVRLNELRNGPFDKKGVGSGILDVAGKVDAKQLARLQEFASPKTSGDGKSEPGLNLAEVNRFLDANFERAKGKRRIVDRGLMNGEFPVLLKVMGKDSPDGRYLSVAEVQTLFVERQLPERLRG